MAKFLAIHRGAAAAPGDIPLSESQQTEFLAAWASWARAHRRALVDPGSPLFRKTRVTADGAEDFTDPTTAYAIVEAASHEDAVRIVSEHPHLGLFPGNSIDVMECPPAPDRPD